MGRLRPGELRAGAWIASVASLLVLLTLASFLLRGSTSPKPGPVAAPTTLQVAETGEDTTVSTSKDVVRRGDSFSSVLLRNRLSVQDLSRVLDCTRRLQLFSPRELQPGQKLSLTTDEYGRLIRMVF